MGRISCCEVHSAERVVSAQQKQLRIMLGESEIYVGYLRSYIYISPARQLILIALAISPLLNL